MRALAKAKPEKYGTAATPAAPPPSKPPAPGLISEADEPTRAERELVEDIARQLGVDRKDPRFLDVLMQRAAGVESTRLGMRLVNDLANVPKFSANPNEHVAYMHAAALLLEMKPANPIEAMLQVQLVGLYNASLRFMHRAFLEGQTLEGVDANIRRVASLTRLMSQLADQLARLQGRMPAQQQVVVKHVDVGEGGSAVIGQVTVNKTPEGGGGQS